jgi:hypothetical protein
VTGFRVILSANPPLTPLVSALPTHSRPAVPDPQADPKRLRRLERTLDSRPLDAWERYRALIDVVDDYREQLDAADKKTRFALIIMGLLNAVNFLLVVQSDVFGLTGALLGRSLAVYAALYAFLSLYFFSQAIEALRPRGAKLFATPVAADGHGGRRLRSMAHVALQDPEAHYAFWQDAQVGQLSREVAYQAQALARINVEKYRALERVYRGLVALTALTAVLVTGLAFRGLVS